MGKNTQSENQRSIKSQFAHIHIWSAEYQMNGAQLITYANKIKYHCDWNYVSNWYFIYTQTF